MKTYLIDAYNYIFKKIVDTKIEVSSGVQKLLVILNELSSKSRDIYIVFIDGDEDTIFNKEIRNKIMCIFSSRGSTADSEIIKYIENNPANNYVVVTDDMELKKRARLLHAKVINCDDFAELCKEAAEVVNTSKEGTENISYFHLKRNPQISNEEVEKLYREFFEPEEKNI